MSGEIPVELGKLRRLELLYINGNLLSGCIPVGLRHVRTDSDLPYCREH